MQASAQSPNALAPGTVVTVQMKGLFALAHHFALVAGRKGPDGLPMVISNSGELGGPGEQSWTSFVKGRRYRAFYPGRLASERVLANAYAMFGTRYHLIFWNCEHFANACHGRAARSRQLHGFALAALIGGLALAAART